MTKKSKRNSITSIITALLKTVLFIHFIIIHITLFRTIHLHKSAATDPDRTVCYEIHMPKKYAGVYCIFAYGAN